MIYFRKLFGGIDKFFTHESSALATDNMAARDLSYNPEHQARTKHVERRHFYIRDMVRKFELIVPHVSTDKTLADFLTKTINAKRFMKLRDMIMNELATVPPTSWSLCHTASHCGNLCSRLFRQ
jgi:hypothetical protein